MPLIHALPIAFVAVAVALSVAAAADRTVTRFATFTAHRELAIRAELARAGAVAMDGRDLEAWEHYFALLERLDRHRPLYRIILVAGVLFVVGFWTAVFWLIVGAVR